MDPHTFITSTGSNGIYGFMESKDSVVTAAINDQGQLYLVRKFTYPSRSWHWEVPAGGSDGQDALTAAKRELEEETGIIARSWEKLGYTRVCSGLMTERTTTYIASDIAFEGTKEVADEQIDTGQFFSMEEIDTMITSGEIDDGQSITSLYFVQKYLHKGQTI
jgi:8-oxo-dGTP pyrophosphatase MutT (NUDIX family)